MAESEDRVTELERLLVEMEEQMLLMEKDIHRLEEQKKMAAKAMGQSMKDLTDFMEMLTYNHQRDQWVVGAAPLAIKMPQISSLLREKEKTKFHG